MIKRHNVESFTLTVCPMLCLLLYFSFTTAISQQSQLTLLISLELHNVYETSSRYRLNYKTASLFLQSLEVNMAKNTISHVTE